MTLCECYECESDCEYYAEPDSDICSACAVGEHLPERDE